ncbi:dihydrofolate reductase [Halosquirtibacter xylanolyticus]|uniref:dihydrofolate reductase n=1 Tax=Halosquirtibacter xylanolyticus TaxID=3374599 RepID=UPI003749BB72|nr:dihydrofolate reductase [Prolixibacteraceae bacterium]
MGDIAMIAAVDQKMGIGNANDMLFFISEDLRRFKSLTTGYPVVMGRKTYESLPHGALPNRRNIVISGQMDLAIKDAEVVHSIDEVKALLNDVSRFFVIGGGVIYTEFMPLATHLFLTHIEEEKEADTFFPELDMSQWQIVETSHREKSDKNPAYTFVDYVKR